MRRKAPTTYKVIETFPAYNSEEERVEALKRLKLDVMRVFQRYAEEHGTS